MDKGLYNKYTVIDSETGEEVIGCFVLKPYKDPIALECLELYAKSCEGTLLSHDLREFTREFKEYRCRTNRICSITSTPVCCAHCPNLDYCLQYFDDVCDLVRYQSVIDIKECDV